MSVQMHLHAYNCRTQ